MGRVAIVGAGIGGLCAALALRARGIDAVAFEQAPAPREVGAGLHLWSNAVRGLREIGVWDAVEPVSVPVERELIYTAQGRLLAEWDVAGASREIGIPSVALSRPDFLRSLVGALDPEALALGRRFTGFSDEGGRVTLRFEDGAEETADALVGADGVHSAARAQLHGSAEPTFRGYTTWRTLVPADEALVPPGELRQYWGRGARFVFFPAGPGTLYFVCLVKAPPRERDVQGETKARLLERYAGFPEPVPSLIASADEERLVRTDIADRNPLRRWGRGRVTLLGDAAHPMAPNTSQGAGMAIEDAAVLARVLAERGGDDPSAALREYERRRWRRVAVNVMTARFPGPLGRLEHPVAVRLRDAYMRLTFGGPVWRQQKRLIAADF